MTKPRPWWGIIVLPLILAGGFVMLAQLSSAPALAQNDVPLGVRPPTPREELPAFAADQLIVKFKPNIPEEAIEQLQAEHGAAEQRVSQFAGFITLSLPEGSNVTEKAEIFSRNPIVEYAHPNFFAQAHFVPDDTFYEQHQWNFDDDSTINAGGASSNPFGGTNGGGIGMEQAWDITTGSASVVVAILDTGLAYEDFSDPNPANCYDRFGQLKKCTGRAIDKYFEGSDRPVNISILAGSDFVNGDDHPNDDEGHGSHVAGTVAQNTNNTLGVAGLAFDTTIMPVKVLDANGSGLFDTIADAIHFATDNGADIINMSLGSSSNAQVMEDAVEYAFNNGVLVVTSAGNAFLSGNTTQYPAAYDASVMAVASTRYDETRSDFSSTGPYVDVAAPGGDTSEDQNEDGFADGVLQQTFLHTCSNEAFDLSVFAYCFYQGTSMASPHVAGLA
ncbi:S8 family serine peptidase, partial [Patescibacteria group bacterium]|nr:S8 family serine peptidase [Patescibacteria group bacterium]